MLERDFALKVSALDASSEPGQEIDESVLDTERLAKRLVVEGWRFLPHSYAIVNQWHLLELRRREGLALKIRDMPFSRPHWRPKEELFEPRAERIIRSIEAAAADEIGDLTFRIFYPFDFAPSSSPQTVVFGALEQQLILPRDIRPSHRLQMPPSLDVRAITPSQWSAEGFYRAGFKTEQVLIVPHGVDPETFHPMPFLRNEIRNKISIEDHHFVFLSIGAMTGNKGIDLLLKAFATVCLKFPQARLVLKGIDPLYASKEFLHKSMSMVSPPDQQRVSDRIIYFGNTCSFRQMAMLYQTADAYVSPYRAEGFNMPVLEAAACGLPVICTDGGSTNDFVIDGFARRIESKKVSARIKGGLDAARLEPNVDHLIALMMSVIEDCSWRQEAAKIGPRHICSNYTWKRVTDTLMAKLFS